MPFDSLFVGVTGLDSYQQQIDVISNNIANVGTTGFKGQRVTFQDLLYQTSGYSSAPNRTQGGVNAVQAGLGVKVASTDTVFQQGGLQTTGINTDLAINGDGFFVLGNTDGSGRPAYTRDGAFSINANGVLYDQTSGLAVLGYQAGTNGQVVQSGAPGALQIPLGLKSQATGTGFGTKLGPTNDKLYDVSFGGNLDQTQYIAFASTGATYLATISTTMYDSLGNAHLVNVVYQPLTVSAGGASVNLPVQVSNSSGSLVTAATEWQYSIQSTDGTLFASTAAGGTSTVSGGFIFFDQNGQYINTSSTGFPSAATHRSGALPTVGQGNQIVVSSWSTPKNANNATPTGTTATPSSIALDFSTVTSLAGNPSATTLAQNGYGQGTLSNITIGLDGTITGAFNNGQNSVLGQVAVARFQNESGLTRQGQSQFITSANSGLPQYGVAGQGNLGQIISGSLEQSNVSLADEFSKMILAQRAFQANASSITTADQDLQTVIGLKR